MPDRPTNILFVMSDDHASTHAMSCYGSRINRTQRTPDLPDKQTDPEGNAKAYERRMKVADAVFQDLRVEHNLPLCRTALVDWRKEEKRKKRR